ncbi:hypothetical protein TPHA_0L02020 [Tetrapisispora phaffii CBS 4417]|uniref:Pre-mRNA-processing protein PRP40 n=1 Tax=Tetrapisispora phaffii (strain ATCC 24235 / CBS 4417 / NBRC 1672 / NRRL Y-8282 / UCD 70-5) TaxID=1071381 RepID=G8C076_TETPH|nr:hypothetical protein TPHA_0L02020 [Tetrapisispora phaffii CBS 4417]CCE65554.1 hypothetical protein TPHA_0L02020 [Tetrapisispora phaffii CBS 4417]
MGADSLWRTAKDSNGKVYYYNTKTGVSQWEKPGVSADIETLKQHGWGVARTKDGKLYYYNSSTGESRWEAPKFEDATTEVSRGKKEVRSEPEVKEDVKVATTRVLSKSDTRSKILHVDSKSKEDAEKDFIAMLKDNNVDATWSFRKIIAELGSTDPRYWVVDDDPLWKQDMFEKYLSNRSEDQLIKEYSEINKFKEAYVNMLKEHEEIKYYSRWKTVKKLISNEPIYKHSTVSESIKKKTFKEYIDKLLKRQTEADKQLKENALKEVREYLHNILHTDGADIAIADPLSWKKVSEQYLFENNKRYMANKHFQVLSKYEVLEEYINIINSLRNQMERKLETLQAHNNTQDRLARDRYKEMLSNVKTTKGDTIRANTTWEQVYPNICKEEEFLGMLGRNGSNAYDIFLDLVGEKKNVIYAHRLVADQILLDNGFRIPDSSSKVQDEHTTVKNYLTQDPRLKDNVDDVDMDLLIEALFKNWKEKENERKQTERRILEQKKRYFKLMLERMFKKHVNVATDKYSDLQELLKDTPEYTALEDNDTLRERLLSEHQQQLKKRMVNSQAPRVSETLGRKRTLAKSNDLDY